MRRRTTNHEREAEARRAEDAARALVEHVERIGDRALLQYHDAILSAPEASALIERAKPIIMREMLRRQEVQRPAPSQTATDRWIYIIRAETGHCKIGKATHAPRRATEIITRLPFAAHVYHTIRSNNNTWAERYLHQKFAHCRTNGEWFLLNEADLTWLRSLDRLDAGDAR